MKEIIVEHSGVIYFCYPPDDTCSIWQMYPMPDSSAHRRSIKKKAIAKMKNSETPNYNYNPVALDLNTNSFVTFHQVTATRDISPCCEKEEKKKESTMTTIFDRDAADKREYLTGRLYSIVESKYDDLRKTYAIADDNYPLDAKEFVDRIISGKYELKKGWDSDEARKWHNPTSYLRFRDPAKPADTAGFEAAREKVDLAEQTVRDAIAIKSATEALDALIAFESATIQ